MNISESNDLHRFLEKLAADSEDAIMGVTVGGIILTWNKAAEQIYGYDAGEAVGRPLALVFPPESGDKITQLLRDVARGEKVARYAVSCRRKDGSLLEISLTVSLVSDDAGKVIGASVIARDVSERRRMEREVLEISANERRRLSYELHDGLGQHLAGIALQTKTVYGAMAAEGAPHAEAVHEIMEMVNDAIRMTRQVARNLNPTNVDAIGLIEALKRLCSETTAAFPVVCEFICEESQLPLEPQTTVALYQLAQEAVHNALVHGGPDRIDVELTRDNNRVTLTIRDDGKGFDSSEKFSGMGLRLMEYRANAINATFNSSSQPGAGTVVRCSMSLSSSVPESGRSPEE
ncbi:MAG TPA: PAS domain-containing sensor histidine kinase [Verrucomicrobiae bacterium]|nr:PAS domain-containing sensor histidine kinase [Verrucomicrobiae bacterium]